MDYNEILRTVSDWLGRGDLAYIAESLVEAGERTLSGRIMCQGNFTTNSFSFTSGTRSYSAPSKLLAIHTLAASSGGLSNALVPTTPAAMRELPPSASGTPKLYSVRGSNIDVWPSPSSNITGWIAYYTFFDSLASATSNKTWLSENEPYAYIYAALCEAEPYLYQDPRLAVWKQKLEETITRVNTVWAVGGPGT